MFLKRTANIRTFFDSANFSALFSQKIYIFSGNGIFLREKEAAYVHFDGLEPSVIRASSVEGSALEIEPSVIRTSSVEGSENRVVAGRVDSVRRGRTGKPADYAMPDRESRRLANCRKCSELIADNQS